MRRLYWMLPAVMDPIEAAHKPGGEKPFDASPAEPVSALPVTQTPSVPILLMVLALVTVAGGGALVRHFGGTIYPIAYAAAVLAALSLPLLLLGDGAGNCWKLPACCWAAPWSNGRCLPFLSSSSRFTGSHVSDPLLFTSPRFRRRRSSMDTHGWTRPDTWSRWARYATPICPSRRSCRIATSPVFTAARSWCTRR